MAAPVRQLNNRAVASVYERKQKLAGAGQGHVPWPVAQASLGERFAGATLISCLSGILSVHSWGLNL